MAMPDAAPPWSRAERGWAYALVLLLTVLLALWGSFLVPFRVGATLVPVSLVIAVVGNVLVGRAGARVAGSTGAIVPAVLWVGLTLVLSSRRADAERHEERAPQRQQDRQQQDQRVRPAALDAAPRAGGVVRELAHACHRARLPDGVSATALPLRR